MKGGRVLTIGYEAQMNMIDASVKTKGQPNIPVYI